MSFFKKTFKKIQTKVKYGVFLDSPEGEVELTRFDVKKLRNIYNTMEARPHERRKFEKLETGEKFSELKPLNRAQSDVYAVYDLEKKVKRMAEDLSKLRSHELSEKKTKIDLTRDLEGLVDYDFTKGARVRGEEAILEETIDDCRLFDSEYVEKMENAIQEYKELKKDMEKIHDELIRDLKVGDWTDAQEFYGRLKEEGPILTSANLNLLIYYNR